MRSIKAEWPWLELLGASLLLGSIIFVVAFFFLNAVNLTAEATIDDGRPTPVTETMSPVSIMRTAAPRFTYCYTIGVTIRRISGDRLAQDSPLSPPTTWASADVLRNYQLARGLIIAIFAPQLLFWSVAWLVALFSYFRSNFHALLNLALVVTIFAIIAIAIVALLGPEVCRGPFALSEPVSTITIATKVVTIQYATIAYGAFAFLLAILVILVYHRLLSTVVDGNEQEIESDSSPRSP